MLSFRKKRKAKLNGNLLLPREIAVSSFNDFARIIIDIAAVTIPVQSVGAVFRFTCTAFREEKVVPFCNIQTNKSTCLQVRGALLLG